MWWPPYPASADRSEGYEDDPPTNTSTRHLPIEARGLGDLTAIVVVVVVVVHPSPRIGGKGV